MGWDPWDHRKFHTNSGIIDQSGTLAQMHLQTPIFSLWEPSPLTTLRVRELNNSCRAPCSVHCNEELFSSTTLCQWSALCAPLERTQYWCSRTKPPILLCCNSTNQLMKMKIFRCHSLAFHVTAFSFFLFVPFHGLLWFLALKNKYLDSA